MNLAELIRATKGDRSYADLERDSRAAIGAKRWQQLATLPMRTFPDPGTIRGVATALPVPERTVVMAVAESLGLQVDSGTTRLVELLPPGTQHLTDEQIAAVVHIVRVLLRQADTRTPAQVAEVIRTTRAPKTPPRGTRTGE